MTVEIVTTKSGKPAVWEWGGSYTNTGWATVICDSAGEPKFPIYTRTRGHLACDRHALFPAGAGDFIIEVRRHHDELEFDLWTVTLERTGASAPELLSHFTYDEVVGKLFPEVAVPDWPMLWNALTAARSKVWCYHCRESHFRRIKSPEDWHLICHGSPLGREARRQAGLAVRDI